jgi:predicted permease
MDSWIQDSRAALRSLRKSPGFAVAVLLTIGLGVGINTAMFSIIYDVLLSPLPYPESGRLTFIWSDLAQTNSRRRPLSGPELADLKSGAKLHSDMGAIWATSGTLVEGGRPAALRVGMVTAGFLRVLGVAPVQGRLFTEADDAPNAPPTVILSEALWRARFGGAGVVGRTLRIDGGWGLEGGTYTVLGVMPAGFEMILPGDASVPRDLDAWVPFRADLATYPRQMSYLRTVGRLAPEADVSRGLDQLADVGRQMVARNPEYGQAGYTFYAVPLQAEAVRGVRPALLALQAAVALVLLVACANVASLLLLRAHARRKEIGLRLALGAPRRRLAPVLLTETVFLAAAGGLLGVGLAHVCLRLVPLVGPGDLPSGRPLALHGSALVFALVATSLACVLVGLAPLVNAWRTDVLAALRAGAADRRAAAAPRVRTALVLAEIGLGVVLSVGAGLLIRTFVKLQAADPGFRSDHVLSFQLSLPVERYGIKDKLARFTRDLERELRALPGVESAGAVNQLPLDQVPNWTTPYRTRVTSKQQDVPEADARLVTPGYFEALHAGLVAGRFFREADDETRPLALIVDEALARKAFAGMDPLDQEMGVQLWSGGGFATQWGRVVGVVRHLRHHKVSEEVREQVFVPFAQAPRNQMGVVVRARLQAESLVPGLTRQLARIDPDLALARVRPLDDYVAKSRAQARFSMILASLFAGAALVLACFGLYGVVSYSVAQRSSEFGVRVALGAGRGDVMRQVLRQGATLAAAGLALGLLASLGVTRWLDSLLFGVASFDPATFLGVPLLLAVTAIVACGLPAWRAARVAPADVLRGE